ncbi:MAG: cobalt ECF transporter T component CbiQ [Acidobacteriota bacterium]
MSQEAINPIPEWMRRPQNRSARSSDRRIQGSASRTLHSLLHALERIFFYDRLSQRQGLMQSLDPRAKLMAGLGLLLSATLLHHLISLVWLHAFIVLVVLIAGLPLFSFLGRVWTVIPFFSAVAALPATLSWVTPGPVVLEIYDFGQPISLGRLELPAVLAVSQSGLEAATLFVTRVGACISVVTLVTMTTPWQKLLRALRTLRIPQLFVFTLAMTYRYVHLILLILLESALAKKGRTLRKGIWREEQSWVASRMGYLFRRSHSMGEAVYSAMLARGFRGEPKVIEEFRWCAADAVALLATTLVSIALVVSEH